MLGFSHNSKSEVFKRELEFDIVATYCGYAVLLDLSSVASGHPGSGLGQIVSLWGQTGHLGASVRQKSLTCQRRKR